MHPWAGMNLSIVLLFFSNVFVFISFFVVNAFQNTFSHSLNASRRARPFWPPGRRFGGRSVLAQAGAARFVGRFVVPRAGAVRFVCVLFYCASNLHLNLPLNLHSRSHCRTLSLNLHLELHSRSRRLNLHLKSSPRPSLAPSRRKIFI